MSRPLTLSLLAVFLLVPLSHADAQCTRLSLEERDASDGASWDQYGRSVAIHDNWTAAGAPDANAGRGAVYVYDRGPSPTEHKVVAASIFADQFGWSVGVWQNWLAVGDPGWNEGAGRVDLYQYNPATTTWEYHSKIEGKAKSIQFGTSLCLNEGRLSVGIPGEQGVGQARLYELDNGAWSLRWILNPVVAVPGMGFGTSVSHANERVVVGIPRPGAVGSIETYWWPDNGIFGTDEEFDPDNGVDERFGLSVHTDGTRVIVGKPSYSQARGCGYVYDANGTAWDFSSRIAPLNRPLGELLGTSVHIQGDVAMLGGPGHTLGGQVVGVVRLLREVGPSHWIEQTSLLGDGTNGSLGASLAADDDEIVAGAPYDHGMQVYTGTAYRFATSDLELNVRPGVVPLFGPVLAEMCGGVPGNLLGTFVVGVDGIPVWGIVGFDVFAATGTWQLWGSHTNPAYSGLNLDVMGLSLNTSWRVVASNVVPVQLN